MMVGYENLLVITRSGTKKLLALVNGCLVITLCPENSFVDKVGILGPFSRLAVVTYPVIVL
mgnify:CR=1 FL=1